MKRIVVLLIGLATMNSHAENWQTLGLCCNAVTNQLCSVKRDQDSVDAPCHCCTPGPSAGCNYGNPPGPGSCSLLADCTDPDACGTSVPSDCSPKGHCSIQTDCNAGEDCCTGACVTAGCFRCGCNP